MSLPTQGCCLTININMGHNKLLAESTYMVVGYFWLVFSQYRLYENYTFEVTYALFFTLCFIPIFDLFHPPSNS